VEIRLGRDGAIILVAQITEDDDTKSIAVVELQLVAKDEIYVVKTAMPRAKFNQNETLLYNKIKK
jgi:hypothetical protein